MSKRACLAARSHLVHESVFCSRAVAAEDSASESIPLKQCRFSSANLRAVTSCG